MSNPNPTQTQATCINHLRASPYASTIGLWGRSMGAVTAMMHADRDPSVAGIVLDSPFSTLSSLARELVAKAEIQYLPGWMVGAALGIIRGTIRKRAGFDIDDLTPIKNAGQAFIPALFAAAEEDDFILPHHAQDIYERYSGDKNMVKFPGQHNSPRPSFFLDSVSIFLFNTMCGAPGAVAAATVAGGGGGRGGGGGGGGGANAAAAAAAAARHQPGRVTNSGALGRQLRSAAATEAAREAAREEERMLQQAIAASLGAGVGSGAGGGAGGGGRDGDAGDSDSVGQGGGSGTAGVAATASAKATTATGVEGETAAERRAQGQRRVGGEGGQGGEGAQQRGASPASVATLVAMGFDSEAAAAALVLCGGRVQDAAVYMSESA